MWNIHDRAIDSLCGLMFLKSISNIISPLDSFIIRRVGRFEILMAHLFAGQPGISGYCGVLFVFGNMRQREW